MKLITTLLALGCALTLLSGCTSTKSSPERHAYSFVAHRSDFVGGNFTVNRQQNYQINLPTFRDIYARGEADRKKGLSEADARRVADAIKQQILEGTESKHAFNGNANDRWSETMEAKDARLFGNELAGAYLDGYQGIK